MDTNTVILVIALSYVIGSFPTAYIAGRIKGINIFDYGSGNMGTTNVVRTLGTAWGAIVFVIDIAK
ncbi:MAG TPA: glycerol-3-phosphate acyltransferase, partial [Aggregatilineales bacterium]|nr:glycerol-3-phosphate acyltransferase [Aggregatilineales bacterium]